MLDGLLGRSGFYSKCKSLIKQTRQRIDVVRRKRNATQKFLRNDIADLLASGLDTTAFARAEGLIAELILSSCYDFIDHVCELILKHLSVLQKLRECPEDCREAVASLMFAAARFSELPELRELRDLFQGRYGSSLEYFVNQKLVENISPKPPSMEKKVQLLQEIASEFSIRWDSGDFMERMSNPSAPEKTQRQSPLTLHAAGKKVMTSLKTVKDEVLTNKKSEATYRNKEREVDRHHMETRRDDMLVKRDDLKHDVSRVPERPADSYKPTSREETMQKRDDISFQRRGPKSEACDSWGNSAAEAVQNGTNRGKKLESVYSHHNRDRHREGHGLERELSNTSSQHKAEPLPANNGTNYRSPANGELAEDGLKTNIRSTIPPPYTKPRKSKHKTDLDLADQNDTLTFNPGTNGDRPDKAQDGMSAPENEEGPACFTEIYYRDTSFTPRRRSLRRKHSRSKSIQDDKVNGEEVKEEEKVIRRVSTSRRKHESRKGLQILFDDDHYKKDDEERMIDKLLLHYSKKPSSADPPKPRKKANGEVNGTSKSPYHRAVDGAKVYESDSTPTTSRSISLPSRHVTDHGPQKKVFTRAVSFQQDTPAKHVHPKLPDYDDLAARFAALRASKG